MTTALDRSTLRPRTKAVGARTAAWPADRGCVPAQAKMLYDELRKILEGRLAALLPEP